MTPELLDIWLHFLILQSLTLLPPPSPPLPPLAPPNYINLWLIMAFIPATIFFFSRSSPLLLGFSAMKSIPWENRDLWFEGLSLYSISKNSSTLKFISFILKFLYLEIGRSGSVLWKSEVGDKIPVSYSHKIGYCYSIVSLNIVGLTSYWASSSLNAERSW